MEDCFCEQTQSGRSHGEGSFFPDACIQTFFQRPEFPTGNLPVVRYDFIYAVKPYFCNRLKVLGIKPFCPLNLLV